MPPSPPSPTLAQYLETQTTRTHAPTSSNPHPNSNSNSHSLNRPYTQLQPHHNQTSYSRMLPGEEEDDLLLNDLSLGGVGDDSAFAVDPEEEDERRSGMSKVGERGMMGAGAGSGSGSGKPSSNHDQASSDLHGTKLEVDEPIRRRKGGRISLFPTRNPSHDNSDSDHDHNDHDDHNDDDDDHTPTQQDQLGDTEDDRMNKDQKLKESLWELKKMVGVFKGFEDSLRCGMEGNERLAIRTSHTDSLLDSYIRLLSQTEHTKKLVMNERWLGVSEDIRAMQEQTRQARIEMETQARLDREASDRARRLALEEEERAAEEERRRVVDLEMRERGGVARGRGGVGRGRGVPGARGRIVSGARPPGGTTTGMTGTGIRKPSGTVPRR